jgi:DNA-binding response OmpR family regulator
MRIGEKRTALSTTPARIRKVLLVDDSVTTLLMERTVLGESAELALFTASDGEEAVRVAAEERPDLVLMDVVMPRMNGVQACRAIRSLAGLEAIPIILVAARGEDDDAIGGYASGCTAYITKPLNPAELIAVVEAHLGATLGEGK